MWARHDVQGPEGWVKRIRHPLVGRLNLDYTYLWLDQRLGTRIVTYTPSDARTSQRLEELEELIDGSAPRLDSAGWAALQSA